INEYLSLGKSVVSSDFADLEEFKHCCHIVQSKEEFSESLKQAARQNSIEQKQKRISIAKENSWRNRAKQLEEWIDG
ncbi:MAG: teichuronic acid biosynthesis glycosyltransferase tuaH, partial [Cytophagales bacterium]